MENEITIYFSNGKRRYFQIVHYININYDLGVMEVGYTDFKDCLIKPERIELENIECIKAR